MSGIRIKLFFRECLGRADVAVGFPTLRGVGTQFVLKYMPFVYILQNRNGKYYIGSTTDLDERMRHHLGGYTPSTKRLGELHLVFSQEYESLKEVRNIELKLKKLKRSDYIANIIKDGFLKIKP